MSAKHETDIRAAMSAMPFGSQVASRIGRLDTAKRIGLPFIARYLETLREVVCEHIEHCDAEHRELLKLQADIQGMRRLFGTDNQGENL